MKESDRQAGRSVPSSVESPARSADGGQGVRCPRRPPATASKTTTTIATATTILRADWPTGATKRCVPPTSSDIWRAPIRNIADGTSIQSSRRSAPDGSIRFHRDTVIGIKCASTRARRTLAISPSLRASRHSATVRQTTTFAAIASSMRSVKDRAESPAQSTTATIGKTGHRARLELPVSRR